MGTLGRDSLGSPGWGTIQGYSYEYSMCTGYIYQDRPAISRRAYLQEGAYLYL